MTNLKETAEMVLNTIYSDNRINTKEYSQLEALQELKNAIEQAGAEKLKQKALDEYKLALLMPRKKKKKAKKSAIMLYNIACWEPFK